MGRVRFHICLINPNSHTSNCFLKVGCNAVCGKDPRAHASQIAVVGVQGWAWHGDGLPLVTDKKKHLIDAGKAIVMAADEAG